MECVAQITHNPIVLMPFGIIVIIFVFSSITLFLIRRKVITKVMHLIVALIAEFPIFMFCCFAFFLAMIFFFDLRDNSRWGDYAPLNAAIKNTCVLDPAQKNCPHTVEEIKHLEPERFSSLLADKEVHYQYTDKNNYTLMIVEKSGYIVIFDPRLKGSQQGLDSIENYVNKCNGGKLRKPMPFQGIWDQI